MKNIICKCENCNATLFMQKNFTGMCELCKYNKEQKDNIKIIKETTIAKLTDYLSSCDERRKNEIMASIMYEISMYPIEWAPK